QPAVDALAGPVAARPTAAAGAVRRRRRTRLLAARGVRPGRPPGRAAAGPRGARLPAGNRVDRPVRDADPPGPAPGQPPGHPRPRLRTVPRRPRWGRLPARGAAAAARPGRGAAGRAGRT